jgi:hypothetical protein
VLLLRQTSRSADFIAHRRLGELYHADFVAREGQTALTLSRSPGLGHRLAGLSVYQQI